MADPMYDSGGNPASHGEPATQPDVDLAAAVTARMPPGSAEFAPWTTPSLQARLIARGLRRRHAGPPAAVARPAACLAEFRRTDAGGRRLPGRCRQRPACA